MLEHSFTHRYRAIVAHSRPCLPKYAVVFNHIERARGARVKSDIDFGSAKSDAVNSWLALSRKKVTNEFRTLELFEHHLDHHDLAERS